MTDTLVRQKNLIKNQDGVLEPSPEFTKKMSQAAQLKDKKEKKDEQKKEDVKQETVTKTDDFNKVLYDFAKIHYSYYDGVKGTRGHKHSEEEMAHKQQANKEMKNYIKDKIMCLPSKLGIF